MLRIFVGDEPSNWPLISPQLAEIFFFKKRIGLVLFNLKFVSPPSDPDWPWADLDRSTRSETIDLTHCLLLMCTLTRLFSQRHFHGWTSVSLSKLFRCWCKQYGVLWTFISRMPMPITADRIHWTESVRYLDVFRGIVTFGLMCSWSSLIVRPQLVKKGSIIDGFDFAHAMTFELYIYLKVMGRRVTQVPQNQFGVVCMAYCSKDTTLLKWKKTKWNARPERYWW